MHQMLRPIKLLAQENPIIDLVVKVQPSFLQKYNLPSNATVSPTPSLMPIYNELLQHPCCEFRPAGSAFNTLRACQVWISHIFVPQPLTVCDPIQISVLHTFYGLHRQ